MKLNISRETLLKPLQMAIGVVERKQTLPILSNILLKTIDNKLSITGTDLEVELIGQSPLKQDLLEDNILTIPGRKLMDICRALPDNAAIELYYDKEKVILRSGRSRFTLSTLPSNDFPNIEPVKSHLAFQIAAKDFKQLLQRSQFAMALQDVRYYLNGLLLETYPDEIRVVATDGHRLAMNVLTAPTNTKHRIQVIIPRKGVLELSRLLNDATDLININISNHYIRVNAKDFIFTSKLIEGRFPDYERVVPKTGNKSFIIDRDLLKQTLQRAAILCNEKFKGIRFELRTNLLRAIANNPEQEAAEEEISIDYTQEDLDIGFNVVYILDILNTIAPGNIRLTFKDSNSSILIEETENKWNSAFVVMPMRL